MSRLERLIYISSATRPFTDDELVELLESARIRNSERKITGVLLYHDGNFLQVLEGFSSDVDDLYNKILRDPRHCRVLKLAAQEVDEREFPSWNMGFKRLMKDELPGFSDILLDANPSPGTLAGFSGKVRIFLNAFRATVGLERVKLVCSENTCSEFA